jgi:hypothetical protein
MRSQIRTRKRLTARLTVSSLRGWLIYQPLAILMALLLLPAVSWMEGGGAGTRPFQAHAQIASLSVSCVPTAGPTTVGQEWPAMCTAANGLPPYSWSITSGALPAGISGPSPVTGGFTDLGGTPTTPGSYTWAITVTDYNGNTATQSFSGTLNSIQGCASTTNTIIQNYCGSGSPLQNDLVQLESDAVNLYLTMHQLPAADAQLVYQYGREDLRNDIRGAMMAILRSIILKPASQRSTHEQNLYIWLQTMVRQNEITQYTQALNNYNSFNSDRCHYQLDPDVASQYNLKFDGTPWCFTGAQTSIIPPPIPDAGYFLSYGLKQSYEKPATTYTYFGGVVAGTTAGEGTTFEVLSGISALAGAIGGFVAFQGVLQVFFLYAAEIVNTVGTGVEMTGIADAAPVIGSIVNFGGVSVGGGATVSVLGPAGLLLACTISEIEAGLEVFSDQYALWILQAISNALTKVQNAPPDLTAFVHDTQGILKLRMTLVSQTLPDVPSTATLPPHRSSDLNFIIAPVGGGLGTSASTLQYQDWFKNTWSVQTYGGWFVGTCSLGAQRTGWCPYVDSGTANLQYVDWSGAPWTASRNGTTFVSAKANPASTDVACPADAATGVSPGPNFSNCLSYVSTSIPVTDSSGNHVTVSFAPQGLPVFTTPSNLSFVPNIASTQTIIASGKPTPQICLDSSNLPTDISLNGGVCSSDGTLQLAFSGDRAQNAPVATYSLTLSASNSAGTTTQTFTVTVSPQLAIISPNSMTVTTGIPASFTVVATGYPAPKLSIDGVTLGGMTFTDNGDGTATIKGIDTATLTLVGCTVNAVTNTPCGIVATNSQGTVRQAFTVDVHSAPGAILVGSGATFYAGAPNNVLLVSTGSITPVSWSFFGGYVQPSWLTLHDNGNGTAMLSGTPPVGTTGTFNVPISPMAAYALISGYLYSINVLNVPVFTTPNTATLTAGTYGSFSIAANLGTLSLAGTLPPGLSFAASGNAATASGTPAAGTGGQYQFTLTDDAGTNGTATQTLTLKVYEAPQITSANTATMFVGVPGLFAVTTTGFPSVSNHMLPANPPPPPTDPSQANGMYFTVTGLPADLSFSNLNPEHFAGGTLTIQGTPSAADAGQHQVQITAQNGVGQAAQQTLTLNIVQITGSAPTSGATCNGNYNGTFTGNLNVSAGQNCAFYGGGVNGNVSVNGGYIALSNTTVSGNVAIQGGSGFSFGPGTKIQGNLSVQNVGSGSTASQICQAAVSGGLDVSGNAIPIQIGNPQNFCFGSSFGKDANILANTASVTFYDNTVGKNLSCSGNTSITGGGNTAQQKGGQCAGF